MDAIQWSEDTRPVKTVKTKRATVGLFSVELYESAIAGRWGWIAILVPRRLGGLGVTMSGSATSDAAAAADAARFVEMLGVLVGES